MKEPENIQMAKESLKCSNSLVTKGKQNKQWLYSSHKLANKKKKKLNMAVNPSVNLNECRMNLTCMLCICQSLSNVNDVPSKNLV